jgi:hypothetical protein
MRQAVEEQLRRVRPADITVQAAVSLLNLASMRLEENGDLGQVREAIEGARALVPVLPEDVSKQLQPALDQLQLAYARAAGPTEGGAPPAAEAPAGEPPPDDAAERAKARSKIWTPPGT